ncbi:MAG: ORF6N domain-containing protein [Bacteroidetes bacterium]|nr:ORF6N domain-containing protein [Bacteroidota bacterium]
MNKNRKAEIIPSKMVDLVYTIRNQRVMLDRDLAQIYETETRKINQQVKRNEARFGEGFSFKLNEQEFQDLREILKSQNMISNWGGVRYPPRAFTEKGIYMLATVLRSPMADEVAKHIINTFTETKKILAENKHLKKRIEQLEKEASAKNRVIKTLQLIAIELNKKS